LRFEVISATKKAPFWPLSWCETKKERELPMFGYAVIAVGGKQHRVSAGEKLLIDLMAHRKVGDKVELTDVLMLGGETYKVGTPIIAGAKVLCTVTDMGAEGLGVKGDKVRVYKKKRRKGFEKTIGHRQKYTELTIDSILG
jgi:large subunit ribosomal protein L21